MHNGGVSCTGCAKQIHPDREGYLTCYSCQGSYHSTCSRLFQKFHYELLVQDTWFRFTCSQCSKSDGALAVASAVAPEDRLLRPKLTWQDAVVILLRHMRHAVPERGVLCRSPGQANTVVFHWDMIAKQLDRHWEKFWPAKRKDTSLASMDQCPPLLSAALTALCTGPDPFLFSANRVFLQQQSLLPAGTNPVDPTNCQYQGYYGLTENRSTSLPTASSDLVFNLGVSPKNGELVPCSTGEPKEDLATMPAQLWPSSSKKWTEILLSNTDFDCPNPTLDTIKIHRASSHTHPHIKISDDGRSVHHPGGYRSARATHGSFEGDWYYEAVLREGHARIGWSQLLADIHAPIGYDEYGYGFGDVTGNVFHTGRPMQYSEPWRPGDVIGCRIIIPPLSNDPETIKAQRENLEQFQEQHEALYPPLRAGKYKIRMKLHPDSCIMFYKNGTPLGKSFGPIYHGKYYPSVAVYKGSLDLNFGPDFAYPPQGEAPRPCQDMCVVPEAFDYGVNLAPVQPGARDNMVHNAC